MGTASAPPRGDRACDTSCRPSQTALQVAPAHTYPCLGSGAEVADPSGASGANGRAVLCEYRTGSRTGDYIRRLCVPVRGGHMFAAPGSILDKQAPSSPRAEARLQETAEGPRDRPRLDAFAAEVALEQRRVGHIARVPSRTESNLTDPNFTVGPMTKPWRPACRCAKQCKAQGKAMRRKGRPRK